MKIDDTTGGACTVTLPTGNSPLGPISPTNINYGPSPFSKWRLAEYGAAVNALQDILDKPKVTHRLVCECGAAACGFTDPGMGHSAWCPLHIA